MMSSSDRSPDYFSGLLVGFLLLAIFGLATYLMFGAMDLKQPVERTYGGDFSAEVSEQRWRNREMVDQEQSGAFDPATVSTELSKIKPIPASKSAVVVPGSPTALNPPKPPAETESEVKEETKTEPAPEPAVPDEAPDADSEKPEPAELKPASAAEDVPAETPATGGKAAPGGKSKAKGKGVNEGRVNKGQASPEVKGKANGKTKAKAKATRAKGGAKSRARSQEASKAKAKGGNQGKAKAATPVPDNGESGAAPGTGQENGSE